MTTDYLKAHLHLVCARQIGSEATEKYDYNKKKLTSSSYFSSQCQPYSFPFF